MSTDVHYYRSVTGKTACGFIPDATATLTDTPDMITCRTCLGMMEGSIPEGAERPKQITEADTVLADFWSMFQKKNEDYTNSGGSVSDNFGLMGQYMKLTDKVHKLRGRMWDEEIIDQAVKLGMPAPIVSGYNFEGPEEILFDIMGHCLLSIMKLREGK